MRDNFYSTRRLLAVLCVASLVLIGCAQASASGPRWVSGPPYFESTGRVVAWYTPTPQYFTDAGDLSPYVNHAAADALVARAATVWNVPTALLEITQGGLLDEHVSASNIAVTGSGLVFPSDVQSVNYQSKQIAVIYDSDGSVTDLMLGAGASDPSGCLQAGVTESVDSFSRGAQILHAVLVLNGRCTGPAPEQQLQLQYQLMRAFGRILGIAWSQNNDNVFTYSPVPTHDQAMHWPVMHPIDIACGPYTYQCFPEPFTLRADDLSSLALLYNIDRYITLGGKHDSLIGASTMTGWVVFPNGQGMEGVNVTARVKKMFTEYVEPWSSVSSVSGYLFRGQNSTAVTQQDGTPGSSMGTTDSSLEGRWYMAAVPIPDDQAWETLVVSTEPVNPLYIGPYAISPLSAGTIAPSGSPAVAESDIAGRDGYNTNVLAPAGGASQCNSAPDGSAAEPQAAASTGSWNGLLCGYGHTAWTSLTVRAGRSFTLEMTALDEAGNATEAKAMPVLGAWRAADDPSEPPTLGSAAVAFNTTVSGMTALNVSTSAPGMLRLALADQRGAGRPDFEYRARILYADQIAPANVPTTGGTVTILGMGFRPGVGVLVHGIAATVTSVTANSITATVPSLRALGLNRSTVVDITVVDPTTGGISAMVEALGYASSTERLVVRSVPSGNVPIGVSATFSVAVVASDGVTPVAGESVAFAVSSGFATVTACNALACTLTTDQDGIASTNVSATAPGLVSLRVATASVSLSQFRFVATAAPDSLHLFGAPSGVLTTGRVASQVFAVKLLAGDGVTPRAGQPITFSASGHPVSFAACGAPTCTAITNASGVAQTAVTPNESGNAILTATSAAGSVSTSIQAASPSMQVATAPSGLVTMGVPAAVSFTVRLVAGDGVSALVGEPVVFMSQGSGVNFTPCGASACTVLSDTHGLASVSVTATALGRVVISAASTEGSATASFTSGAEVLRVLSAPAETAVVGTPAGTPFQVGVFQADGTTPVPGAVVTFAIVAGTGDVVGCAQVPCTINTNAQGLASRSVTPTVAGTLTIRASLNASSVSATILAKIPYQSVTLDQPLVYVAEGTSLGWTSNASVSDDSGPVNGIRVTWSGSSNLGFQASSSMTSAGTTTMHVALQTLGAGVSASGRVCAWVSVCASVSAVGVSAAEYNVAITDGASQNVDMGTDFAPIRLRVVNATHQPIVGVPVLLRQTVTAWEAPCPEHGRCAAAAVLSTSEKTLTTDLDGYLTVPVGGLAAVPSVVTLAIAAGTQGAATTTLERHP